MINATVLMSGAAFFSDQFAINAHMDDQVPVDVTKAQQEHAAIKAAFEAAGIKVIQVRPPTNCQDGVYTANWALCHDGKALLSVLPNKRQAETPYAREVLQKQGLEILELPEGIRFSGQGDALICGNIVFTGSQYRTDLSAHQYVQDLFGLQVISLQTIPKRRWWGMGRPVINEVTGWPDSYYYDIDLALAVLKPDLIAYCPDVFVPESRKILADLPLKKIVVSRAEATNGFACNLVSTGEVAVMSSLAPKLQADIEAAGLCTITPSVSELAKGGGYIRCTSLTLP